MRAAIRSNQEFILGFLCALAISVSVAIFSTLEPPKYLWSQEAAGWAQAVGTILAIFVTYGIASSQARTATKRAQEEASRKAKVLAQFIVPALKTIEADVGQAHLFCVQYEKVGLRNLAKINFAQLSFRPLGSTDFILNNAHHLPADLGASVTQLLGFHVIVDTNINLMLEQARKDGFIDSLPIRLLLPWLKIMQTLVDDIFQEIPPIHDLDLSKLK